MPTVPKRSAGQTGASYVGRSHFIRFKEPLTLDCSYSCPSRRRTNVERYYTNSTTRIPPLCFKCHSLVRRLYVSLKVGKPHILSLNLFILASSGHSLYRWRVIKYWSFFVRLACIFSAPLNTKNLQHTIHIQRETFQSLCPSRDNSGYCTHWYVLVSRRGASTEWKGYRILPALREW